MQDLKGQNYARFGHFDAWKWAKLLFLVALTPTKTKRATTMFFATPKNSEMIEIGSRCEIHDLQY